MGTGREGGREGKEGESENQGWAQMCVSCSSSPTLCDPIDCSPPGSSVHGILQARILEWIAITFSKGSSSFEGLNPHLLKSLALADGLFSMDG